MRKVVCVAGLPGSGKSYWCSLYARENGADVFDDISVPGHFDAFEFWLRSEKLLAVINDINFCLSSTREKAESKIKSYVKEIEIEWIFFENAPDKCRRNVVYRNDGRLVEPTIRNLTRRYSIPDGVVPIRIWTPEEGS